MTAIIQNQIESLLKDRIGLSASILGSKEIGRAVEQRMTAENSPNLQTYLQQLQISAEELEALIELLIVPETWFFRDWEPFVFLERYVKSEWLPTQSHRILRVLSAPCSSGEEPYSIAMSLLQAGLTPNQFQIDAVDISNCSLDKARKAVYTQNSFRVNNLQFQQLYFTKLGNKYQLCDLVKNAVNFMHGNLVDPNFITGKNPYNVIWCRNVLIYFDDAAREKSIRNLNGLLKNKGLLFLGHAEKMQMLESTFVSVQHPFAFAYRKQENDNGGLINGEKLLMRHQPLISTGEVSLSRLDRQNKSPLFSRKDSPTIARQNNPTANRETTQLKTIPLSDPATSAREIGKGQNSTQLPATDLETARKLADGGQLSAATTMCENYLKQNFTSVEAYILMGEIHQAKGLDVQAEQCFQKAIYLEPNNYDALLHLTLLAENRGDTARAAVLRQRIQRLQKS
ncbi:MAG: CheR family methyltransferase [Microcoleus anatoxicus]|uniref:CheR family methyltransferase n=1 Tax=Microcoleus anatoxicus TaxID=2705319 RepID=UPI00366A6547